TASFRYPLGARRERGRVMKIMDVASAIELVGDQATVAVSGGGYRVEPEALLEGLERRFLQRGSPQGLTLFCPSMVERSRGGRGGVGTGINRLAKRGLLSKVICGSYSRVKGAEINQLIYDDAVEAYNIPMGTAFKWLQAIAGGQPGLVTTVGLHTFVDPRQEGGRMNAAAREPLSRLETIAGHEVLYYPSFPIDVALIKGTTADERGNIYLDREAFSHGVLHTAMAAKNSGGIVLAQVNRIAQLGSIHPRMGRVPGGMVDVISVVPDVWEDEQDPVLTGEITGVLATTIGIADSVRQAIARRALQEAQSDEVVNLGAGLPMYDIPNAAFASGRHQDIYFTVEQGPYGGLPRVGGVARNPEVILDSLEVFDYYEGGGPDLSCLSFAQVDAKGNVNVSKFAGMMPGTGGFVNIVHRIPRLVFCGALTAGGLVERAEGGRLVIEEEGRVKKLVPRVDQITFNGSVGLQKGQDVTVITDRAVFKLGPDGFALTEIAPGIDVTRDVLEQICFDVTVASDLKVMDEELFA
ncbi:MAG TPA: CoA-transferase, partial [Trueperaceae bacterium]